MRTAIKVDVYDNRLIRGTDGKCRIKLKLSVNHEWIKHQYFSIVSLPRDSIIVDHAVFITLLSVYSPIFTLLR
jgi:hypothetical protein